MCKRELIQRAGRGFDPCSNLILWFTNRSRGNRSNNSDLNSDFKLSRFRFNLESSKFPDLAFLFGIFITTWNTYKLYECYFIDIWWSFTYVGLLPFLWTPLSIHPWFYVLILTELHILHYYSFASLVHLWTVLHMPWNSQDGITSAFGSDQLDV